ncbi:MAG: hypothetical protein WCI27_06835 [Candidatus Omnitrophota bacterium]
MLSINRSRKAQNISAEYVILIFMVVGAIVGMSTYTRRTMQARVFEITKLAAIKASAALYRPVGLEYEPYYTESSIRTDADSQTVENVGLSFQKDASSLRLINSESKQTAPKNE